MTSSPVGSRSTAIHLLWFGGTIAWLAHLLLAYAIAEFGCVSGWDEIRVLGIPLTTLLLLGVSVLTCILAIASAISAWRGRPRIDAGEDDGPAGSIAFLARAGFLTSGLFAFVILAESIPIIFYFSEC